MGLFVVYRYILYPPKTVILFVKYLSEQLLQIVLKKRYKVVDLRLVIYYSMKNLEFNEKDLKTIKKMNMRMPVIQIEEGAFYGDIRHVWKK